MSIETSHYKLCKKQLMERHVDMFNLDDYRAKENEMRLNIGNGLMSADDDRFIRLLRIAESQAALLQKCKEVLFRFDVSVLTTQSREMYEIVCAELKRLPERKDYEQR